LLIDSFKTQAALLSVVQKSAMVSYKTSFHPAFTGHFFPLEILGLTVYQDYSFVYLIIYS
jgi:hypothetical protein